MSFFDTKEEVIEIELTRYGNYLLSQGKFNPEYYAFYDDDILYDKKYLWDPNNDVEDAKSETPELQNDSEMRIKENTPRLHLQNVFSCVETDFKKHKEQAKAKSFVGSYMPSTLPPPEPIQVSTEKVHAFSNPLGTVGGENNYAPAFSVYYMHGSLTGSSDFLALAHTGSGGKTSERILNIPQLSSSINYEVMAKHDPTFTPPDPNTVELDMAEIDNPEPGGVKSYTFADGTYLEIKEDYLLIEVLEENTDYLKENFDIEVYELQKEYDKDGNATGKEEYKPLAFAAKDPDDYEQYGSVYGSDLSEIPDLDSNYVEYYFNILVDDEIDTEVYCENRKRISSKGIFNDSTFDCPDIITQPDIYNTDQSEDGDPC